MALGLAQCLLLALLAPHIAFADELQPVSSEPPSPELVGLASHKKIAQIDKELFQQLAELAKFNIHFHLEANHHQKWRALTYPLARESGTAL